MCSARLCGEFRPHQIALVSATFSIVSGNSSPFCRNSFDHRASRCGAPECVRKRNRILSCTCWSGVQHRLIASVIEKADGQGTLQLRPRRALFKIPPCRRARDHMQFRFAHGSFETQQETIIEVRWIIHAVFVENERVGQSADLPTAGASRWSCARGVKLPSQARCRLCLDRLR